MPSLIEELQRDALDSRVSVTSLLQKCLVVGSKLGVGELADWARQELDGYKDISKVPPYRDAHGTPQVANPYRGLQPLLFEDPKLCERFSVMHFHQPVSEIEYTLRDSEKRRSSSLQWSYPAIVERQMMDAMDLPLTPVLSIHVGQLSRMLEGVRRIVLDWSVQLESAGIKGDGMSFSREEQQKARNVTYNIENYIHGTFERTQVQVGTSHSSQTQSLSYDADNLRQIAALLKTNSASLPFEGDVRRQWDTEIQKLETEANSPSARPAAVTESLRTIRSLLEGVAGNLIAAGLLYQLHKLL